MKILFYELNEVPWRVVDIYIQKHPKSALASLLQNSLQLTTVTKDSGELHPWSTWPTVHRGVYNDTHKIHFLNQEIATSYAPHWKIFAQAGLKVGVFGSLQSWPIPQGEEYAFYVPDTFSPDAQTHPSSLKLFQEFNLAQTARDGGTNPKKISLSPQLLKDIVTLITQGTTFKTVGMLANQLIREKLNPSFKSRRSIFQAPVAFDFFYKLIQTTKPDFATFFSNHVAGMMHRYWKYAFPQDFSYTLQNEHEALKGDNVWQAMHITDGQIALLKKFADENDYVLMIASSMGQEAIDRGDYVGELRINNFKQFYKQLGYKGKVKNNLAMQPDFAFSFESKKDLKDFKNRVKKLMTGTHQPLFTFKEAGLTLNCNLQSSPPIVLAGVILQEGKRVPFKDLGVHIEIRDQGTAYHQPEGIWITYKKGLRKNISRQKVESIKIAPTLLKLFQLKKPAYMDTPEPLVMKELQ